MMFGNMLIIINAEDYFSSTKKQFEDNELKDIEESLEHNQEGTDIVFVVKIDREEGKKPDSRKKLFKILSKYNAKEFQVIPTYRTAEIAAWVKNKAKEKGLTIKDDAMELFIEQIGNNLRIFNNELDKLQLTAYPEKTVTKKMIEEICVSNQDLFNITNCLIKNEKDKALLEFKKLTDKKHPLEILSAIQTILRQWIIIKVKANAPVHEVMNLSGIRNEFRINILKKELKDIQTKELINLKNNLYDIEYRLKKGEVIDSLSEVECALIR
jgi:DNA polymerase-3 subunit delta